MNEDINDLDRTDEEILTYEVSDEAMEAAAGNKQGVPTETHIVGQWSCCPT